MANEGQALAFGAYADRYERHRPEYPVTAVQWILRPLATWTAPLRVVDGGAGTGKLTRLLAAEGHDVLAVDPDPLMLARLREAVPGVPTAEGTGESLPLDDASVDAVMFAQSWHWVDRERGVLELARVLRPGGVAGIMWNLRDRDDPFQAELSEIGTGRMDAAGRYDPAVTPVDHPAFFTPGEHTDVENNVRLTPDEVALLASTWSYVALDADVDAILERIRRLAAGYVEPDGRITYRQFTRCHRVTRL